MVIRVKYHLLVGFVHYAVLIDVGYPHRVLQERLYVGDVPHSRVAVYPVLELHQKPEPLYILFIYHPVLGVIEQRVQRREGFHEILVIFRFYETVVDLARVIHLDPAVTAPVLPVIEFQRLVLQVGVVRASDHVLQSLFVLQVYCQVIRLVLINIDDFAKPFHVGEIDLAVRVHVGLGYSFLQLDVGRDRVDVFVVDPAVAVDVYLCLGLQVDVSRQVQTAVQVHVFVHVQVPVAIEVLRDVKIAVVVEVLIAVEIFVAVKVLYAEVHAAVVVQVARVVRYPHGREFAVRDACISRRSQRLFVLDIEIAVAVKVLCPVHYFIQVGIDPG